MTILRADMSAAVVVVSVGQDLVGFPKAAAYLYRSLWLSAVPTHAADRPPVGDAKLCHIVEHWDQSELYNSTNRTVHVYSGGGASAVRLSLNGQALQTQPTDVAGTVSFNNVTWSTGTLLATCLDSSGSTIATHSRATSGPGATIELRVDAPSPRTGTGTALFADGADCALVAALVRDAQGNVAHGASDQITFRVVSGPGRIVATNSGDVRSHAPNQIPTHAVYHGKVRAIVRVTRDAGSPDWHRRRLRQIDMDAGPTQVVVDDDNELLLGATELVVEASGP
eukprot:SAG22_NODE_1912_length_3328_cov_1.207185_4_plen_281_part_01